MKYQDFVVQLGISPAGALQIRVQKSPAGEGEILLDVPAWLPELAFAFAEGPHRRGAAGELKRDFRRRAEAAPVVEEIGGQLHDLLFSGVVGRLWDQSLGALSGRRDAGLRLRLQIALEQAQFLGDLPWELLRNRDTGAYLALDRRTPILRHLEVARPLLPQQLPASLKVLGVASAPQELASLDLAAEKQNLRTGKRRRGWQVSFLEQPTVEQLRRSLIDQGSHVLHFMGHGSFDPERREGALYFEDSQGYGAPFAGTALAAKLAGVPSLRLVVLNACETAISGSAGNAYGGVAAALVRSGLPAVIAMQRPISDKAAIAFSSAFYHHLATGGDLEAALTEGRQAIHTLSPTGDEWSIPVLFSRAAEQGIFADPDARAAARRRSLVAAGTALLVLLGGGLALRQMGGRAGGEGIYGIALEQVIATGVDGLYGRLVSIEILEDGRMRFHFAFENTSDQKKVVGFDFEKTYLADEYGNAYQVRGSSVPGPKAPSMTQEVPAGDSRTYWVDFQAPQDGARRLHVELASPERSDTKFTFFTVALPAYPATLSAPSPRPPRLPESDALKLEVKIDNGRKDVSSEVRQLEVAENKMRLSFDMWNRGSLPLKADFDPSRIELSDGQGNVLRPIGMGMIEQGRQVDLRLDSMLRRAVRTRLFIDFPAPKTASEHWSLQLATRPGSDFRFAGTALKVVGSIFERAKRAIEEFALKARPKLEARPRVDRPPPAVEAKPADSPPAAAPVVPETRFEVAPGGQEVGSSQVEVRARILGVERLSNQRLRFVVEIANVGSELLEVPLRLGATKLSDDLGRQFRLLASSFGEVGEAAPEAVRFTVAPGTGRELFFEFSGRVQGAEVFTFLLGSADPERLRFKPIQARLPPE